MASCNLDHLPAEDIIMLAVLCDMGFLAYGNRAIAVTLLDTGLNLSKLVGIQLIGIGLQCSLKAQRQCVAIGLVFSDLKKKSN
jgi:hypothetical protein